MPSFKIEPRGTAVLGIDLQNCFVEGSPVAAPEGPEVVAKLNELAHHFRTVGV
jgi:biuret amidohydrolase